MGSPPEFEVALGGEGVALGERDRELLAAVDREGSINAAAGSLGRSYSRAQQRIVALEEAFGDLVERSRGGSDGGGSRLTDRARGLLTRYERLRAAVGGVTETAETPLSGEVVEREGRLATVDTPVGTVRALVPPDCTQVSLAVQADAVTLHAPDASPGPDATSARNRLRGTVTAVEVAEGVSEVRVDVGGARDLRATVTRASVDRLDLAVGQTVVASFKATATRGVAAT